MADLPGGFFGDYNVADFLDEDERAAVASGSNVLGALLSGFPANTHFTAAGMEETCPAREDYPAIDEEVMVSDSDMDIDDFDEGDVVVEEKEGEMDEEGQELSGSGGEGSLDLDGAEQLNTEQDLPILGYGEHQERIFCFSKIFSGKGVRNFFEEYDEEDRKVKEQNRALAEKIKKRKASFLEGQDGTQAYRDDCQTWINLDLDDEDVFEHPPSPRSRRVGHSKGNSTRYDTPANNKIIQKFIEVDLPGSGLASGSSGQENTEYLLGNLLQWEDDIILTAEDEQRAIAKSRKLLKEDPLAWTYNPHLLGDAWMKNIIWDSDKNIPPPPLLWDLNDSHMRFQLQEGATMSIAENAVATVLPHPTRKALVTKRSSGNQDVPDGLAYFFLSGGKFYEKERVLGHDLAKEGYASPHSVAALTLNTLPLHSGEEELKDLHRSRNFWVSSADLTPTRRSTSNGSANIVFQSVTGRAGTIVRNINEPLDVPIGQLYLQVKERAFPDSRSLDPVFMMGNNFQPIPAETTLEMLGIGESIYHLHILLSFPKVQLLQASALQLPNPDSKTPLRPPGAFGKRKDLTGVDAHLLLLEYMEENPLLVGYPGMGFTTKTYHRRKEAQSLDAGTKCDKSIGGSKWAVGARKCITKEDYSPFFGTLEEGSARLTVESPMFRSIAAAHPSPPSDFLLIRSASGSIFLREITGCLAVGQQLPLVKIPPPATSTLKDFEERRLVAFACRKLRQKCNRSSDTAEVSVDELMDFFPLSETVIKARLKDRCSCLPKRGEDGSYVLKPGASLHSEHELRQLLSPEDVCAFDSTRGVRARLLHMGVKHPERLMSMSMEKWRLAIELLPEEKRPIAHLILETIQAAPWAQSEGYLSWRQGRSQVSVIGVGDPSGRSLGCSFLKEPIRKTDDTRPTLRQPTGITGTGADLRKLGAEDAVKALQGLPKHFHVGINFDELKKFDRWEIIKYVRNIATAAVKDGVELSPDLAKFARHGRSTQQVAAGLKRKAEDVFKRQVMLLAGEDLDCSAPKLVADNETRSKVNSVHGSCRIRRLILNPNGTERVVFLPIERYNQIVWSGVEVLQDMRRVIEGRQLSAVGMDGIMNRSTMDKVDFEPDGNPNRKPSKRPAAEDLHENLGMKLKVPAKKQKTVKKVCTIAGRSEAQTGAKQKTPVKKTVSKKRKPPARAIPRSSGIAGDQLLANQAPNILQSEAPDVAAGEIYEDVSSPVVQESSQQDPDTNQECPGSSHVDEPAPPASIPGSVIPNRKGKLFRTKDGRRMTGRKVLNSKVLVKVLGALNRFDHSKWFKAQVKKNIAPDYNDFVKAADEMWLDKMSGKIKGLKYSTAAAFKEDVDQIHSNAVAYNSPGCGTYGGEIFISWTSELVRICQEELDKHKDQIEEEEERIQEEDAGKEQRKTGIGKST